jgi:hypothetical protein
MGACTARGWRATDMRAWPLHVVFSAILLGSIACKQPAVDVLDILSTKSARRSGFS